jgi:hypothetical protein
MNPDCSLLAWTRNRETLKPNVSDLFRGRVDGFTLDRLTKYLNALGKDVQIKVTNGPGRTVVV